MLWKLNTYLSTHIWVWVVLGPILTTFGVINIIGGEWLVGSLMLVLAVFDVLEIKAVYRRRKNNG